MTKLRIFKAIPNSFKIWYGFHCFYLASSHRSWARIVPGVANIAFQFPSFRHIVKALPELNARKQNIAGRCSEHDQDLTALA